MEKEPSCPENVVLHQSENAWKPSFKQNHPIDEKEKLRRCVQGTLNKLTFEKFEILLSKMKTLEFNKTEDLELLIDLIFDNAIHEPHFSILYANLCEKLCQIRLCIVDSTGKKINFHDHLLMKCFYEFEIWCFEENIKTNPPYTEINSSDRSLQIFEEEMRKIKCRQIGIVRFIGALFNFDLVMKPTMHDCIGRLLSRLDNKSLELVCEFFKTAGKKLDEKNLEETENFSAKNQVDFYFEQMQNLVDESMTNTRIKFMLQDVIELRKNYWIPRRIKTIPQTIDEIHQLIELDNKSSY